MHVSHNPSPSQGCSNNIAEYKAIIVGLELALLTPIAHLTIHEDSKLKVKQLNGEYNVKEAELIPYHKQAGKLLSQFEKVKILHVRRVTNVWTDALGLATSLSVPDGEVRYITVVRRRLLTPLPKALPDPESEGVFSVGVATEPIED